MTSASFSEAFPLVPFKAVLGPYCSHEIIFFGAVLEFMRTFFGNNSFFFNPFFQWAFYGTIDISQKSFNRYCSYNRYFINDHIPTLAPTK